MEKKIVFFCGGRGCKTIISEFANDTSYKISAIINAFDDGKSTGIIKRYFNMLGPSDIRKLQITLASNKPHIQEIVNVLEYRTSTHEEFLTIIHNFRLFLQHYKLDKNSVEFLTSTIERFSIHLLKHFRDIDFADFCIGNCVYAGAFLQNNRSYSKTLAQLSNILECRGEVLNITNRNLCLFGIDNIGNIYPNEHSIDNATKATFLNIVIVDKNFAATSAKYLKNMSLNDKVRYLEAVKVNPPLNKKAKDAIRECDIIIYGPGTLTTSLLPIFKIRGVASLISKNKHSIKYFISNLDSEYPNYYNSTFSEIQDFLKCMKHERNASEVINFVLSDNNRALSIQEINALQMDNVKALNAEMLTEIVNSHDGKLTKNLIEKLVV